MLSIVVGCSTLPFVGTTSEEYVYPPHCFQSREVAERLGEEFPSEFDFLLTHNATFAERHGFDALQDYCERR